MLHLYNTRTREKAKFVPLQEGKVGLYVCGITVYDLSHMGHARTYLSFDVLVRYMRHLGLDVKYVRNITDIDDKIIARANENGESFEALTARTIAMMHEDFAAINLLEPDVEPTVSGHMDEIIEIIQRLMDKGYAYQAKSGDVLFDVSKYEDYGKLSKQDLDQLKAGARVEVAAGKDDPLDFVLWKTTKPGEPAWQSPWGEGRPGWHIECSAMNHKHLGAHFDIHGGGSDLTFPHHENEVAQSCCAYDTPYVNVWMHAGMVQVNDEKMSKSLNNFFTVREIQEEFDLEVIRFFLLSAHYRSPLNFSRELVESAQRGLERLYNAKNNLGYLITHADATLPTENEMELTRELNSFIEKFSTEMDDDFNTANGIAVIFDLVKYINSNIDEHTSMNALKTAQEILAELCGVLGLLAKKDENSLEDEIEELIEERQRARKNKDFKKADEIRDKLLAKEIVLEDTPSGVKWARK